MENLNIQKLKAINFFYKKWVKKIGWAYHINVENNISESFGALDKLKENLGIIYKPKNKINNLFIDSSFDKSELCKIGKKFETDKSPHNIVKHRHPYTPIYDLIFSTFRRRKINLAEIGIFYNSSINMWRRYFEFAKIFGFDSEKNLIKNAELQNLKDAYYFQMDVKSTNSIKNNLLTLKTNFDILIDDSTHNFFDQVRIIKNFTHYMNTGGITVIEDIPEYDESFSENNFYKELKNFFKFFDSIKFINCDSINKFSGEHYNNKLLILVRNNRKLKQ